MAAQNLDNELSRLRIDKSRKRQKRRGGRGLLLLLVLGVLGGGYAYYKAHAAVEVKAAKPVVSRETLLNTPVLTAGGYVIPRNKIEVSSKIIGRIEEIFVDRGSQVKQGDVLLRIEDADLQAQVRQAEATLNAARARLAELRTGSRPEEIAASQAAVNSAEATAKNAAADLARVQSLGTDEVISRQAIDEFKMKFDVAQAGLESARKNFELVRKGPRQETIDAAAAQVSQAEANVEYVKTQLNYSVIRAPISGTVLEKLAKKGELVSFQNFGGTRGAKTSLVSMADLTDLQVEIDVNESDVAKVHLKQACEIRLDSAPGVVLKGEVDEIAPEADRQKATVQIKVRISAPPAGIHPEVNARVTFLESGRPAASDAPRVYVPRAALTGTGESMTVYVIEGGLAQMKAVKVGDESPKGVQVLEGLTGSEELVLEPPAGLKNGTRVTVAGTPS